MITKELEVLNELGFHARVASKIVRTTRKFSSSIVVNKNGNEYDLKNVTGVITVNAKKGDVLTLVFSGEDEVPAAQAMEELFQDKFGERE